MGPPTTCPADIECEDKILQQLLNTLRTEMDACVTLDTEQDIRIQTLRDRINSLPESPLEQRIDAAAAQTQKYADSLPATVQTFAEFDTYVSNVQTKVPELQQQGQTNLTNRDTYVSKIDGIISRTNGIVNSANECQFFIVSAQGINWEIDQIFTTRYLLHPESKYLNQKDKVKYYFEFLRRAIQMFYNLGTWGGTYKLPTKTSTFDYNGDEQNDYFTPVTYPERNAPPGNHNRMSRFYINKNKALKDLERVVEDNSPDQYSKLLAVASDIKQHFASK